MMNIKPLFVSLFVFAAISIGCGDPSREEQINHMEKQVDVLVENIEKAFKKMATLNPEESHKYQEGLDGLAKLGQYRTVLRSMFKDFLRDCDDSDLPVMREIIDLAADFVKEMAKSNGLAELHKSLGSFKSRADALNTRFKSYKPKQKTLEASARIALKLQQLGVPVQFNHGMKI